MRGDGTRILVCRYRPRALPKKDETWDEWQRDLGPSADLHAAFWGKGQEPISWAEYRRRYLAEIAREPARSLMRALADRVAAGETITLLCSKACVDEAACHRALLRDQIEAKIDGGAGGRPTLGGTPSMAARRRRRRTAGSRPLRSRRPAAHRSCRTACTNRGYRGRPSDARFRRARFAPSIDRRSRAQM